MSVITEQIQSESLVAEKEVSQDFTSKIQKAQSQLLDCDDNSTRRVISTLTVQEV